MVNLDKLQNIKKSIEEMNISYQKEILKILNKEDSVIISENNNGTFINLSNLNDIILQKLEKYIEYVNNQQHILKFIEEEKSNIENEFFSKEKKISRTKKIITKGKTESNI